MSEAKSERAAKQVDSDSLDTTDDATNIEMDRTIAADPEATLEGDSSLPKFRGNPDAFRERAEVVNPICGSVTSFTEPTTGKLLTREPYTSEPHIHKPTLAEPIASTGSMTSITSIGRDTINREISRVSEAASQTAAVYRTRRRYWQQVQPLIQQYGGLVSLVLLGLGVLVLGFVLLATLLAFIDFIPLASASLKLIGFGYTLWFVSRHLIFDRRRQELAADFQTLKQQIIGQ